jgi:hypothetical protein
MIVLLVASAFLNVWLNGKLQTNTPASVDNDEPSVQATFSSFRTDRETTRQEIFDYLDAIMVSESSSEDAKAAAETQKLDICTEMETELTLESLIKSRGFNDVIVTLSDTNCTVVVADDDLQAAEVAQILSIVTSETEYEASQVIVCPY